MSAVTSVEIAGDWTDWQRVAMTPDGAGGYATAALLDPGTYAYKLVVDGEWMFDPGEPFRTYSGGVENSALRVGDCTEPLLELVSVDRTATSIAATVKVWRGAGGPAVPVRASLRRDFQDAPVDVTADGALVTVRADGLAPGKATLAIEADGAESILLPVWIEAAAFDWRDSPIYMVMLDRFRNGDPANDPAATAGAESTADYHGGDIAGLTEAIEAGYFDDLGIKTLWISPWSENTARVHTEDSHGVTAYHGYWPTRGRELDPRFGSPTDLEAMVAAAHARGIRIIMDIVINHIHEDHEYAATSPEWFRTGCVCGTDGCGWTERRLECLFHDYMPDINWQTGAAARFVADALWWIERYDLDGLRVDAVKHVEDLAVRNLSAAIAERFERAGTEYFLLGETAMGWAGHSVEANREEYDTISRYIGEYGLTGQFDFVLYHGVSYRVFANDEYGMLHADFWTKASLDNYPADAIMTPYIGSHDTQRFLTLATYKGTDGIAFNKWPDQGLPPRPDADEPYARTALALTWVLSLPGAPLLYYGDEYGEFGGSDPDNRHMWRDAADRTAREAALFEHVRKVTRARAASSALARGGYRTVDGTETFLCFARETGEDFALVAVNRSGALVTRTIDVPMGATRVVDALSDASYDVAGGAIELTLPAWGSAIVVPE